MFRAERHAGVGGKAPVRSEHQVGLIENRVKYARFNHSSFEVVNGDDRRYSSEKSEGTLVTPQERLKVLFLNQFLVSVFTAGEGHFKPKFVS